MNRTAKSMFAMLIAVAMVFTALPMGAFAETGDTHSLGQSGTITVFEYIEPVEVEKGTAEADIPFPATVTATVSFDNAATPAVTQADTISVAVSVGEWRLAFGSYDPDAENTRYVFEAVRESLVLTNGVILPEDVDLPCMAVDIGEVEIGIAPTAAAISNTLDLSADATKGNIETDGYAYTQNGVGSAVSLLQLKDFNLSTTDGTGLILPSNKKVKIELLGGTTNTITVNASTTPAYGISGCISAITGDGTLNVNVTGTTSVIAVDLAISDSQAVTISGVTVNLTALSGSMTNTALKTRSLNGAIAIKDGGILNADGSNSNVGVGIDTSGTGSDILLGVFSSTDADALGTLTAKGGKQAIFSTTGVVPYQNGLVYEQSANYNGSGATTGTPTLYFPMWKNDTTNKYIKMEPEAVGGKQQIGTSGTYWELKDNNTTLEITGTGDMPGDQPWYSNIGTITTITIADGITQIGNFAFVNMTALASVTIPNSVTTIGSYAFSSCALLASITIPTGVNSIGDDAFFGCAALNAITIPAGVTSIGDDAFTNCTSLISIEFKGNTPPTFGNDAFSNTSVTGTVTVPAGTADTYKTELTEVGLTFGAGAWTITGGGGETTTYTVSGTVKEGSQADAGAKVIIMLGSAQIANTTTDTDGKFSFTDISPGLYNLVIKGGERIVTVPVSVTNANVTVDVVYPQHIQNSVVEVEPSAPVQAVVGGLQEVFKDENAVTDGSKGFTSAELTDIKNGATGEIKVVVDEIQAADDQTAIENAATGETVGLFIDLSVFKTITPSGGNPDETKLNELPTLLAVTFELPSSLQGKTISAIYRVHDGSVDTITKSANSDGEKFSQSGDTITLSVKKFSTYGLAYTNTSPTPTPTPTPSGGSSSGGGSSKQDSIPAPNPWLEPNPAQSLASGANKAQQDTVRTKSTDTYGVRKASWQKLKGYRYYHDTMEGNAVQVRLYIDNPAAMNRDMYVTGFVKGSFVDNRKAKFEKWFTNQIRVIHMDEAEPWGQEVQIAAKVDLAGMDTKKLYFYAYDKKANKYTRITEPKYWIDKNGYLHFYTELAGDFVISENPLEKKF